MIWLTQSIGQENCRKGPDTNWRLGASKLPKRVRATRAQPPANPTRKGDTLWRRAGRPCSTSTNSCEFGKRSCEGRAHTRCVARERPTSGRSGPSWPEVQRNAGDLGEALARVMYSRDRR